MAAIKIHENKKITDPKKILQAEEIFFKQIIMLPLISPREQRRAVKVNLPDIGR